ncbi:MAG: DNA translocase FtsK 4TM domain-containing protein [Candidatus Porifericomitaceae bacterium WSBS_2022_MAG_OTU9]
MAALGQATSRQAAVRLSLQRIAAICSEIWLLFSLFCGVFLVVSLSTFTATDPGWSNASSNTSGLLGNSGGTIGAWSADVILNLFGYPGYLAPLVLVCGCWYLGRFRFTTLYYADMGLRFTGMLLLLLGSCALAEVYYAHRDILPVGSGGGGVVGSFLADILLEPVGTTGFSLLMLMALASGIALAFNISWLDVATRLGAFLCLVGDRLRQQTLLGSKACMNWLRAKLDSLRQNHAAAMASRHRETLGTGSCQTAEDGVESALNPLPQENHEVAMPLVAANGSSSALSSFGHDADNEPSIPDVATMKSEHLQGSTVVNPFADQKLSQNFGMVGMAGIDDGEADTDATSGQDMPESEPEVMRH